MEPTTTPERELTGKQAKFLACLLTHPNVERAAEAAGIGHTTAFRYLQDEHFQAVYQREKQDAIKRATAQLTAACGEAVETLQDVMREAVGQPAARVSAAKAILDTAFRAAELETTTERLAALEAKLAELAGATPEPPKGRAA